MDGGMVGGDNPNLSPESGERGRAASEDAGTGTRAKAERGLAQLAQRAGLDKEGASRPGSPSEDMAELVERIFGYDPEDEADDWWVQWGSVQERISMLSIAGEFAVHVDHAHEEESD